MQNHYYYSLINKQFTYYTIMTKIDFTDKLNFTRSLVLENLKLHYFPGGTFGRGENVRLLLEDAGINYEYIRFREDTWPGAKTAL